MQGRLHLRVRAREPEAHIESRVEIDRAWATAQQAVEVGAAKGGAGRWWLERAVREVVRGEVERLEGEHVVHETVEIGWSAASRRTVSGAFTGKGVGGANEMRVPRAGAWGVCSIERGEDTGPIEHLFPSCPNLKTTGFVALPVSL